MVSGREGKGKGMHWGMGEFYFTVSKSCCVWYLTTWLMHAGTEHEEKKGVTLGNVSREVETRTTQYIL